MPEYTELRDELQRARANREAAAAALAAARERLKRLIGQRNARERVFEPPQPKTTGESARSSRRARGGSSKRLSNDAQAALHNARVVEAGVLRGLERFTDPRTNIGRLNDQTPILMMPVRLETRFKNVSAVDNHQHRSSGCESTPTSAGSIRSIRRSAEPELANVQAYWVNVWKAGGVEEQRRGAWRTLVTRHGAGRARWIASQYQPVNLPRRRRSRRERKT